ncbi:Flagellar hook protein FlgE [Zhongshania aliphaticivorans]|uniref:Flagellar hook protein FlgE n=1 Tax=Zhongshania aliphaticivorans TaxID=1470434 RepID=A0A5S9P5C8_9GAMM|nr:flagellar hook protein FlgE [Zhongshania aliphaticivorans]CAA0091056.1 Flagellar hook protein FlgE [Zhongshania aliphaticivorans]CAA0098542.1 Flagellar hook protein FlgE [Zhongshania aliphaticivorans]
MSFRIALSGLNAASAQLDVTANNIANVNTTGFKGSRAAFADVYATSNNDVTKTTPGAGVRLNTITQEFSQGNIDFTDNNLDLAISGEGFFTMKGSSGVTYSRAGAFSVDRDGYVVNNSLERLQVFPPSGDGSFSTGSLSDLQLEVSENAPQSTERAEIGVNLPADAPEPAVSPFDPSLPTSYNHSTSMTIYDSLGTQHTATMYFVKDSAANSWNQQLYVDDAAVGGFNSMSFSNSGELQVPTSGLITYPSFDPGTGSENLDLSFDFTSTTQYGQEFGVNNLQQDGYTTGRLTGIEVDTSGVVSARFTNGQSKELGKVAMANFSNPNGLQQQGDTSWAETYASGSPRVGEAGSSDFGLLQSGALESSNVDLTSQLVEMITAQRNFQANTQMISTADAVTQAIINIR